MSSQNKRTVMTRDICQQLREDVGNDITFSEEQVRAFISALATDEQLFNDVLSLVSVVHQEDRHFHIEYPESL